MDIATLVGVGMLMIERIIDYIIKNTRSQSWYCVCCTCEISEKEEKSNNVHCTERVEKIEEV